MTKSEARMILDHAQTADRALQEVRMDIINKIGVTSPELARIEAAMESVQAIMVAASEELPNG